MSGDDLELKELEQFYGTEKYHSLKPLFSTVATDGVAYVMNNGYGWFVTDSLAVVEHSNDERIRRAEFLTVKLRLLGENRGKMTIEDGNGNVYYEQDYEFTDAKRELTLYWQEGEINVILLAGEY